MPVEQKPRSSAWQSAITTLLEVQPPFLWRPPRISRASATCCGRCTGPVPPSCFRTSGTWPPRERWSRPVFPSSRPPAAAVRRANAYLGAGADCVYPILLWETDALRRFISEVNGPVNVARLPQAPSFAELAAAGVARVSWGTFLHLDAMARFAEQLALLQK